jgi:hypothetical protein
MTILYFNIDGSIPEITLKYVHMRHLLIIYVRREKTKNKFMYIRYCIFRTSL